jgi:rod shape-determining protein MreC
VTALVRRALTPGADGLGRAGQGVGDWWGGLWSAGGLRAENRRLQALATAAALYEARVEALERDLATARKAAEAPGMGRAKVRCRIVGFFPTENRLTLDVGAEQGVKPGQAVATPEGMLAVVQTVESGRSQALLVTSPACKFGAMTVGAGVRVPGLARGDSPTRIVLDLLESGETKVGDAVVTTGYAESIPRGLPVGTVVEIVNDPNYGLRRAFVVPNADVGDASEVWVLK